MKQPGDKVNALLGIDTDGNEIRISSMGGRGVVLYFYPKDNTPGCSAEACSLRDAYSQIEAQGYAVVGVSRDSAASHRRFADKFQLRFPLIVDADHRLCEEFGVWQLKKMAGREYMGIVRTTFIISAEGVVEHVITKVNTKAAAEQVLPLLGK